MSFKTCSYCCRLYRMTCHIFITLRLKIIQPRWPSCGFHIWLWSTPKKKNSGITHPKNEQNGLGWDNGFGPTPNLQFSSQLWGILKANSHQTSSNPQIPKRNPGLVLDLQYLFFWERGTVRVRFFHWCCIKISYIYIYQRCCCKISSIWYIYICIPQKFHPAGSQETKHIAHTQRETK